MQRVKVITIGLIMLLSMGLTSLAQAASGFTDVPNSHGFKDNIDHLVKLGAIKGYQDGRFNPAGNVNRGQAAKIITIALDMPLVNPAKPTFTDVPRKHEFYQHIETLVANDIIKGYPDGTFGVAKPVIRSHMAKIVSNSLDLTEMSNIQFTDVSKNNEFYPYINKMATAGITTGRLDGTYGTNVHVNRGQMAAFVSRGVDHVEGVIRPTPTPDPEPEPGSDAYMYRQVQFGMTKDQVKATEGTPSKETQNELVYEEVDMDIFEADITFSFKNNRVTAMEFDIDIRNVLLEEAEGFFQGLVEDVYEPQFFEPSSIVAEWEPGNNALTANWDIEDHEDLLVYLQLTKSDGPGPLKLVFKIYEF